MPRNLLTRVEIDTIVGLKNDGRPMSVICSIVGRPYGTVYYALKRNGVSTQTPHSLFQRKTAIERFELSHEKTSACWNWTKTIHSKGYGLIGVDGKREYSHRFSYRQFNGPIQEGMLVIHSCDNRRCVNPEHLRVGTAKDNTRDMMERGRDRHGMIGPRRLTECQVVEIRKRAEIGHSVSDIAKNLPVTLDHVRDIIRGRAWKHLL